MSDEDPFAQFKLTFFEECNELLSDVEQYLADLEAGDYNNDTLHAIFRAVHSIKAGAGAFSYERMVNFTHKFETFLDELRETRIAVDDGVVETLFRGFDILTDLVGFAQKDETPPNSFGEGALDAIEAYLGEGPAKPIIPATKAASGTPSGSSSSGKTTAVATPTPTEDGLQHFRIEFTPKEAMYRHANEPLLIIRELQTLGKASVVVDTSRLPSLQAMEPEDAYFSWVIDLHTSKGRTDIDEVFEFVLDDCDLTIVTLNASGDVTGVDVSPGRPDEDDDGFGFFVDDTDITKGTVSAVAVAALIEEPVSATVDIETTALADDEDSSPRGVQAQSAAPKATSIRVDIDRVDRLVNMVGELVITQSMLAQEVNAISIDQSSRVGTGMAELSMHIRELQENVMAIRMQPVKSVFSRMPRIVRDVSKKLGKKVRLVTVGETTEVDKTVIEELADPLTHMIRNSLDHGLENPADRVAAGKEEEGTIRLSAEHRGGRIIIEVSDDGRGINRERVLSLAKSKGIVSQDAQLSDDETDNLLFAPGFSTADTVTDLSGRGVGLDVVRRNIQSLGGRVSVQSHPGRGTRFQLTLPLTLAVLDGMIVGVGDQKYVIPINNILETVRPLAKDVNKLVDGGMVMRVRGEYIRIVPIGHLFGLDEGEVDPTKALVVLVEADGGRVVGMLIDYLAGQQQVVIKSLESNYKAVEGIASATILGDGSVCLILDIDRLADMEVPVGAGAYQASNFIQPPASEQRLQASAR